MTERHTQITLSFLVVGHTKFSPDWCFGLFKRLFRRTKVGSLQGIAKVANSSAHCNHAQLCSTEDGTTIVKTSEWTGFLAPHFRKFSGIKKYHHFRFTSSEPGVVYARKRCDTPEEEIQLLNGCWSPGYDEEPEVVHPRGLSASRQWYLYEKIREFCPESDRDVTCPLPTVPKPSSRAGTPADDADEHTQPSTANGESSLPPTKKARLCGICRGEGHTRKTCPDRSSREA
jgi:hypothetical protein